MHGRRGRMEPVLSCAGPSPRGAALLPLLPRLLLCLLLVANAVTGAWAATLMAMPVDAAATTAPAAGEAPCHEAMAANDAGPDHDTTPDAPMPGCSDSRHCDCLPQASLILAPVLPLLAAVPSRQWQPLPPVAHRAPQMGEPVRPPIAA